MAEEQHQPPAANISPSYQNSRTLAADNYDKSFRHQPLPGDNYIRLIEVLDVTDESVRCRLTCWPISNAPLYIAISYTWGDSDVLKSITLNDQRLEITQNCEYVLRQARWYSGSRPGYYWVDAICIDQQNTPEKNEQVARMGDIYRDARCVLACVGAHDDASRMLFSWVRGHTDYLLSVASSSTARSAGMRSRWLRLRWLLAHRSRTLITQLPTALIGFSTRPYFTRLWVLQELFHGREIVLCCGTDHIPFATLSAFVLIAEDPRYDLFRTFGEEIFLNRVAKGWRLLRRPWVSFIVCRRWSYVPLRAHLRFGAISTPGSGRLPLHSLISQTRYLECCDPRDKVYGLLSTVDWGDRNPIQPDYSKSMLSLYIEVMTVIYKELEERGHGNLLGEFNETARAALNYDFLGACVHRLGDTNAVVTDVIEVRELPWLEAAQTKLRDGKNTQLCISFGDRKWQLDEPLESLSADLKPQNEDARSQWWDRPLRIFITDQGDACLVEYSWGIEPGVSILKLNGPKLDVSQGSHDTWPVVMGLVAYKASPSSETWIAGDALIYELGDCVLKYRLDGAFWDGDPVGMVVTKGMCRDGSDQLGSRVLPTRLQSAPVYGIRRKWEDFIKDLGPCSGCGAC